MLSGLPDHMVEELRARFPRTRIAELVSRVAAFPRECFASAKYLGRYVGVSKRTAFRYLRTLKDSGGLERVPGSRRYDSMPVDADRPAALRGHGFAITRFVGWLAPFVHQGQSIVKAKMSAKQRAKLRREQEHREFRAKKRREAAQWAAAEYPQLRELERIALERADRATKPPRQRMGQRVPTRDVEEIDPDDTDFWRFDHTGPPG